MSRRKMERNTPAALCVCEIDASMGNSSPLARRPTAGSPTPFSARTRPFRGSGRRAGRGCRESAPGSGCRDWRRWRGPPCRKTRSAAELNITMRCCASTVMMGSVADWMMSRSGGALAIGFMGGDRDVRAPARHIEGLQHIRAGRATGAMHCAKRPTCPRPCFRARGRPVRGRRAQSTAGKTGSAQSLAWPAVRICRLKRHKAASLSPASTSYCEQQDGTGPGAGHGGDIVHRAKSAIARHHADDRVGGQQRTLGVQEGPHGRRQRAQPHRRDQDDVVVGVRDGPA